MACQKSPSEEGQSEVKALDQVLQLNDSNPRLCGAGAKSSDAKFSAQADAFLTDQNGQPTDKFIVNRSQDPTLKKFVAQTLVAVPPVVLIQVFNPSDQGQIVLSDEDVKKHCRAIQGKESYGCVQKSRNKKLQVYIRASKAVVGMKLLELLSYHMSKNLDRLGEEGFSLTQSKNENLKQAQALFRTQINAVRTLRDDLKVAFDKDAALSNGAAINEYRAMSEKQKVHFVFSQTIDSFYCSTQSFSAFGNLAQSGKLKNTNDAFYKQGPQGSLYSILGNPWHIQSK